MKRPPSSGSSSRALPWAVPLACAAALASGCGKASPGEVESAILTTIYEDRSFFDVVCGFPIDQPVRARVEVIDAEGERLPWLGIGNGSAPGVAHIRITNVTRKGVDGTQTCEAKIGFTWRRQLKSTFDRTHRLGQSTSRFFAEGFRKL